RAVTVQVQNPQTQGLSHGTPSIGPGEQLDLTGVTFTGTLQGTLGDHTISLQITRTSGESIHGIIINNGRADESIHGIIINGGRDGVGSIHGIFKPGQVGFGAPFERYNTLIVRVPLAADTWLNVSGTITRTSDPCLFRIEGSFVL